MFVQVSLTKTEKHQRHLGERCIRRREVEFSFGPSQSVLVESGQYVVSAQGFGLGHQLLLRQRPVKHIQDLCSEHRGPSQDLHVLLQGGSGSESVWPLRISCISVCPLFIPEEVQQWGQYVSCEDRKPLFRGSWRGHETHQFILKCSCQTGRETKTLLINTLVPKSKAAWVTNNYCTSCCYYTLFFKDCGSIQTFRI